MATRKLYPPGIFGVHLQVHDLDRSVSFYQDALGRRWFSTHDPDGIDIVVLPPRRATHRRNTAGRGLLGTLTPFAAPWKRMSVTLTDLQA
jgi:Bleomycin resistance protein-like N-terminal